MRFFRLAFVAVFSIAAALPSPSGAQSDSVFPPLRAVDRANFDTTCAPCNDFFGYVNGGWYKRTQIPARYMMTGVDRDVQDRTEALLKSILERSVAEGPEARDPTTKRLAIFYGTCMDSARADREGYQPIRADLGRISGIRSRPELAAALGDLQRIGVDVGIPFYVAPDFRNSDIQFLHLYQGGIGLPDRDMYLLPDSSQAAIRAQYLAHVGRMLSLIEVPATDRAAAKVLALETALAKGAFRAEDIRDASKTDHRMSMAQLQALGKEMDWTAFFRAAGAPPVTNLNVAAPSEVQALDSLVRAAPLDDWKTYLRWQLASAAAPYLSTPFQKEDLEFRKIVFGETELKPRWQRCLDATDASIGEALGQAYVKVTFPPAAKARMKAMIRNLREAMRDRISALDWMSDSTKAAAQQKLSALVAKIGYPDQWRDYSRLHLAQGPFVRNVFAATAVETQRVLAQVYKPVDRSEWGMTPPTFNAYNNPTFNEIVFPAGILQPPVFDPSADDAVNYGATGATIGHEMTHGFDDQGRKFDAKGNLRNWWASKDSAEFEARSDVIVKQYNAYIAIDTFHVNGKLTLGENIADIGGLMIAHDAWRRSLAGKPEPPPIDGFTSEQRFFISYAAFWRDKMRPETERTLVISNPHSSIRWRVNGVVGHLPEFAKAFHCQASDSIPRSPAQRMQIW